MAAAEHFGGVGEAVEVGGSPVRLRPPSRTFDGRDIFAPVAAALAAGAPLHELGEPLDAPSPCTIELPRARAVDGILIAHVAHVDGFGNAALDATVAQLDDLCDEGAQVSVGAASGIRVARRADAFGDVAPGELLIHEDARGMVALAVNLGSAAELLGVVRDDELELMHP